MVSETGAAGVAGPGEPGDLLGGGLEEPQLPRLAIGHHHAAITQADRADDRAKGDGAFILTEHEKRPRIESTCGHGDRSVGDNANPGAVADRRGALPRDGEGDQPAGNE